MASSKQTNIMSDSNHSIHEFDFNLICEYYLNFERQGPGSPEETLRAISFIPPLAPDARIADLGCGTGGQTLVLAQNIPGTVTGIDLFPKFIDRFNHNAAALGLGHRVKGIVGSMDNLPFQENELDLIWSEGAIYNIGFERGLREWHRFLKPGGCLAVTEASWFTPERPSEITDFWNDAYPGIDTIPVKVAQMQEAGYVPLAAFILPEHCWTEHFYAPQKEAQTAFLEKYAGNATVEAFIATERHEMELYYRYKAFYGYVFYIGMKI